MKKQFLKLKRKFTTEEINGVTHFAVVVDEDESKRQLKNNMDIIQGNISRILESKKISQSELARAIESEPNHINYILRKKNKGITIKVLGRIAKALEVPLKTLVA